MPKFKIKIPVTVLLLILALTISQAKTSVPADANGSGKTTGVQSHQIPDSSVREKISLDFGWKFAFGHPYDTKKDFNNGTGYFSYFAKAGYGDGAASKDFNDRTWRTIDVPHDWAVEAPFDSKGTHSHGYKAIGRNFPDRSVGWYRKAIFIPESDLGKRITVDFEGVFRNSIVWINGFYLGEEHSGYQGFSYDITDYLNYGGENVIAVRVDATLEEGWFYEGAGIYRHVWLTKTAPLHVARDGTFVSSELNDGGAEVTARAAIANDGTGKAAFEITQTILGPDNKPVGKSTLEKLELEPGVNKEYFSHISVKNPELWSIDTPYLYTLVTAIVSGGKVVDQFETSFGIRSIRFDPDKGFFLNGKHIEIKGTDDHQDHAGVGVAVPDALWDFRIKRLKEMGSNAIRCSHNPPAPEFLDACDRLGMLVLDENRLMGTNHEHLDLLKRLILRDRNHPSVILWSLGNEEWSIEGNVTGARIAATMQAFVHRLDSTRKVTTAISGGWGNGISTVIDVMGFNYLSHGNIDEYHQKFPNQPAVGTEESTTSGTRGIYVDDRANGHMAATDRTGKEPSIETGWKYYDARPFLAGLFFWTGFDYKGEPNPLAWPAVSSQYGIVDACGFPKDDFYYLKSVWTDEPVLHIFPHWNWQGDEGKEIKVWAYSNCDQVELFLNGKSQGKKAVPKDSHVEWAVKYHPGILRAEGYKNGMKIIEKKVETTGVPTVIQLKADRTSIKGDGKDVSVITVSVLDKEGRVNPIASNEITFEVSGPGKIIGVGNGDPVSHEPDRFIPAYNSVDIEDWVAAGVDSSEIHDEVSPGFDDSGWAPAFRRGRRGDNSGPQRTIFRGHFSLPEISDNDTVNLYINDFGENQSVYVNGKLILKDMPVKQEGHRISLSKEYLVSGKNLLAVVATPEQRGRGGRGEMNRGTVQVITGAGPWERKVFNGLAQVILQSDTKSGEVALKASSPGLSGAELKLQVVK